MGRADYAHPDLSPSRQRQGYGIDAYQHGVLPAAPMPPVHPHHRSNMYDDSIRGAAIKNHFPQHFMDEAIARQHIQSAGFKDGSHSVQQAPAGTAFDSPAPRMPQKHANQSSTSPTPSILHSDPSIATERIRLQLVWDLTPIMMWLDLHDSGEAFFQAFQLQADRRKRVFDRATMTIFLMTDKTTPENEAYPLSLNEDDLHVDWDTTVTWLEEHRREKAPHIFGKIDDG